MIRRGTLKLISSGKGKKKYKHCVVYLCNESTVEFSLEEWTIYRDNDWIEFDRKDGTEFKCFYIANIISLNFGYTEKTKTNSPVEGGLKPVA